MRIVREVKLSTKGQVVIPKWVREKLNLSVEDRLMIDLRGEEMILRPKIKLSKLRGIDKIEKSSEKLDGIRGEWDEEFAVRH